MYDPESYGPEGVAVRSPGRPKHVVADIRYGPDNGPSWSVCSCGATFTADTPDQMSMDYAAHQRAKGNRAGKSGHVVTPTPRSALLGTCRVAGCEVVRGECVRHDGVLQ